MKDRFFYCIALDSLTLFGATAGARRSSPAVERMAQPSGRPLTAVLARARAEMAREIFRCISTMPTGWQTDVWMLTQHFPGDYARLGQDVRVGAGGTNASSTSVYLDDVPVAKI